MAKTQWTYWADYDCSELAKVPLKDRQEVWTDWLQERVRRFVLEPLRKIKGDLIQPPDDSSALLIFSVSLLCAVEAMGKYLKGSNTSGNRVRFEAFVTSYMHEDYNLKSINGDKYVTLLWKHFRNGIAHGFAIAKGKFEQNNDEPYFVESRDAADHAVLSLNWDKLFDDFEEACNRYFKDVRSADTTGTILSNFTSVFEDVIVKRN